MGNNVVSGVADGTVAPGSTEAINGGQLALRDQAINSLGGEVNKLDNRINASVPVQPLWQPSIRRTSILMISGISPSAMATIAARMPVLSVPSTNRTKIQPSRSAAPSAAVKT